VSKKVILTGLRANNDLHIGNYFGALLPIVDMANTHAGEYQVNLFVPDLHSFTTPIDHTLLQGQINATLRMFAASALPLDNDDVHIYRQSYIPAHSELAWVLSCFAGVGQMRRMTQFKDKIKTPDEAALQIFGKLLNKEYAELFEKYKKLDHCLEKDKIRTELFRVLDQLQRSLDDQDLDTARLGLFNYPVLMASDILLYNATYVPVGDDQTQHLEFTRDIAQRMNTKFGQLFTVPLEVKKQHELFAKDQGLRIMDLADPSKKMSKSDASSKGAIFLNDTPEDAKKKIMSATTDSEGLVLYDPKARPGLSNLIDILALLDGMSPQEVAKRYEGQTMYGPLKEELASKMAYFLTEFQDKLDKVDETKLHNKLKASEDAMNIVANETLLRVQKAVGLR
jgi:tryptophanyl-tRNA synthetase